MEEPSGGQANIPIITDLKDLIDKTKERYKNTNPNDDRWPCPSCFVFTKTKIQLSIHISKEHQNVKKSNKKGFCSHLYKDFELNRVNDTSSGPRDDKENKKIRQRLSRKCKNDSRNEKSNMETTSNDLIEFLKIVEEDYPEFNTSYEQSPKENQV